tara:strand:+ start:100 stop:240 length:141 start_codon:yes stop_codon:yes gene_type:complete
MAVEVACRGRLLEEDEDEEEELLLVALPGEGALGFPNRVRMSLLMF